MCNGLGIIVDKELNLWFSEPNKSGHCSHSLTINRLGWNDNANAYLRYFVRVEFADWQPESFQFDESTTLPGWCENERDTIREKCITLLSRCATASAEFEKVRATASAEFEKVRATASAEFEKVRDTAWAEFEKVRDPAYDILASALSVIPGYVPEKGIT